MMCSFIIYIRTSCVFIIYIIIIYIRQSDMLGPDFLKLVITQHVTRTSVSQSVLSYIFFHIIIYILYYK
jgi:hypothetical protein